MFRDEVGDEDDIGLRNETVAKNDGLVRNACSFKCKPYAEGTMAMEIET